MTPEQKAHEAAMIAEYQRERDRHSQTAAACLASEAALDEARRERDEARAEEQATRARWQSSLVSLRTGTLERERDAALAREARLREAAAPFAKPLRVLAPDRVTIIERAATPEGTALRAALVDPDATTWLADRERAAALQAAGAAWAIAAPDRQVDSSALVEVVDRIMAARKEGT